MPENLTTSRQFISLGQRMKPANASGPFGAGAPPSLVSAATTSGSSKIVLHVKGELVDNRARRTAGRKQALPGRDPKLLMDSPIDGRSGAAGTAALHCSPQARGLLPAWAAATASSYCRWQDRRCRSSDWSVRRWCCGTAHGSNACRSPLQHDDGKVRRRADARRAVSQSCRRWLEIGDNSGTDGTGIFWLTTNRFGK